MAVLRAHGPAVIARAHPSLFRTRVAIRLSLVPSWLHAESQIGGIEEVIGGCLVRGERVVWVACNRLRCMDRMRDGKEGYICGKDSCGSECIGSYLALEKNITWSSTYLCATFSHFEKQKPFFPSRVRSIFLGEYYEHVMCLWPEQMLHPRRRLGNSDRRRKFVHITTQHLESSKLISTLFSSEIDALKCNATSALPENPIHTTRTLSIRKKRGKNFLNNPNRVAHTKSDCEE